MAVSRSSFQVMGENMADEILETPMPRYLLSVHTPAADGSSSERPNGDMGQMMERITALEDRMRAANALVSSARLADVSETVVATASHTDGSEPTLTDGPYLESKELIGGFYIVEADSREAAIEWATETSRAVGMPIEMRPFVDYRDR